MSLNCFLIATQLISIVSVINAVPIDVGVNNLTSVPDPVNINGSLTVLDTTMATIDLTTISSGKNDSRDGRSGEDLIIPNQESIKNESKESDKSSAIRFPREDEIDSVMINSTSTNSSSVDQIATNSPVADISLEPNSTLIEGLVESSSSSSSSSSTSSSSSSSSMIVDLSPSTSSSTSKPSTTTTEQLIVDSSSTVAPRIGRSQSGTIDDEINSNLNDTLSILTTLSSILNQSTTNDSISSV
ncbi:uncharacterized protein LOC128394960 [Panonychus citri]|uniref:uncharacterized protein LOC128394960 n=1 Tax=Panonychus citri TaxID=50023 RepID=UPI0023081E1D|nr:uncharacterized protein LOC128394960 [Panonychus citri]